MPKKIKASILITISLLLMLFSYRSFMEYLYVYLGNRAFKSENFESAIKSYEKAIKFSTAPSITENILKSDYAAQNFEALLKEEHALAFERGNSFVKLGEKMDAEKSKDQKENYEKALLEYKKALLTSEDINIKKNYEIVKNRLDEDKKDNQENSSDQQNEDNKDSKDNKNNQDNKQNQNQQNSEDNQDNQSDNSNKEDSKDESQNSDEKNENQKNQEKDNQNQNQNEKNNQQEQKNDRENENKSNDNNSENQGSKDEKSNQPSGTPSGEQPFSEEERAKEELQYMLKKLEGNEKQAFKNNEQFMNLNNEKNEKRW